MNLDGGLYKLSGPASNPAKGILLDGVDAATVSTFNMLSLSPSAWWQSSTNTFQTVNGTKASSSLQPVGSWLDISGNGSDLSQTQISAPDDRPLLSLNYTNGLSVLTFDGIQQFISGTFLSLVLPVAIYMVVEIDGTGVILDGKTSVKGQLSVNGSNQLVANSGSALTGPTIIPTTIYTVQCLFGGAVSSISVNGGTKTTGDSGSNDPVAISFGANFDGTSPGQMVLGEAVVFQGGNVPADAQNELNLLQYFRNKWRHY